MVNQLGKFCPCTADLGQLLRELMSPQNTMGMEQEQAFSKSRKSLLDPLCWLYMIHVKMKVSANTSSFGLRAVLLQQSTETQEWTYCICFMVTGRHREKVCTDRKRGACSTMGLTKVPWLHPRTSSQNRNWPHASCFLLSNRRLDGLPPQVLRVHLRLERFDLQMYHGPGNLLYAADALLHAFYSAAVHTLELQVVNKPPDYTWNQRNLNTYL